MLRLQVPGNFSKGQGQQAKKQRLGKNAKSMQVLVFFRSLFKHFVSTFIRIDSYRSNERMDDFSFLLLSFRLVFGDNFGQFHSPNPLIVGRRPSSGTVRRQSHDAACFIPNYSDDNHANPAGHPGHDRAGKLQLEQQRQLPFVFYGSRAHLLHKHGSCGQNLQHDNRQSEFVPLKF